MHLYKTIIETYTKWEFQKHPTKTDNNPEGSLETTENPLLWASLGHHHTEIDSNPDISAETTENPLLWTSLEEKLVIPTQTSLANSTKLTMANNVVSALMDVNVSLDKSHHQLMLLILIGLFLLISLSLTIGVLVFCKKKNSVFMLQKCEQDSEYELDDMNTEIENTDSEYEDIDAALSDSRRSETYPCLSKVVNDDRCARYSQKVLQNDGSQSDSGSPSTIPLLRSSNINLVDSQENRIRKKVQRPSLKKSFTFSTSRECKKLLRQKKDIDHSGTGPFANKQEPGMLEPTSAVEEIQPTVMNKDHSNQYYHTVLRQNSETTPTAEGEVEETDTTTMNRGQNNQYYHTVLRQNSESIPTSEREIEEIDTTTMKEGQNNQYYHTMLRHCSESNDSFPVRFREDSSPSEINVHTVEATIEHHYEVTDAGLTQEDEDLDFSGKLEIL